MTSILGNEKVVVCGNFNGYTKRRPKNWIEQGYKMIVPFRFKWRAKVGRVECNCIEVKEHFQPWYGTTWIHSDACAIRAHLKRYPGIQNFYWDRDPLVIAMTD